MTAAIVIAKRPVAGRVKTRLCPPLTPVQAADLAAAALADTLSAVERSATTERVLCFDGATTGWLRPGWTSRRQCEGTLDVRLADSFAAVRGPALVVGMDTPQLSPDLLARFDPTHYDACLGPTADGGYWTLGLSDPTLARAAVLGVPMSSTHTFDTQLERLGSLGLRVQLLPLLVDVDTLADAREVAALAPDTGFATAFRTAVPRQGAA